jgi:hypothetical protein
MILKNGDIVPIVEINARKSMGFINYSIDQHLKKFNVSGNLVSINFGYNETNKVTFDKILSEMDKQGLCFYPGLENGIMPISANTLFISHDLKIINKIESNMNAPYKGRMYISVVSKDFETRNILVKKLRELLDGLSIKVYD